MQVLPGELPILSPAGRSSAGSASASSRPSPSRRHHQLFDTPGPVIARLETTLEISTDGIPHSRTPPTDSVAPEDVRHRLPRGRSTTLSIAVDPSPETDRGQQLTIQRPRIAPIRHHAPVRLASTGGTPDTLSDVVGRVGAMLRGGVGARASEGATTSAAVCVGFAFALPRPRLLTSLPRGSGAFRAGGRSVAPRASSCTCWAMAATSRYDVTGGRPAGGAPASPATGRVRSSHRQGTRRLIACSGRTAASPDPLARAPTRASASPGSRPAGMIRSLTSDAEVDAYRPHRPVPS